MKRSALAWLALLAWSAEASAQQAPAADAATPPPTAPDATQPPEPPSAKEPVEVRVIGAKADSLQKIPGSATVLSSKEIASAQPYDAAEMLNRVPGITARQEQESGARLDIGVHGLDPGRSRNLLVLEDGIPISINPYAEPDLYIAPQIDRMRGIEVVKGSGSILFGPSTIGGVINFLTFAPPPRQTVALEADYGSFNYRKLLARYGDTFGPVRYVVQGTYRGGDGMEGLPFTTLDVFSKIAVDTSKTGQVTLKLDFLDDATYANDIGLTRNMFASDPGERALASDDRLHQRRYAASLIYEDRLGPSTKVQTLVYAYETPRTWRRQSWQRTLAGSPPPPGGFLSFAGDTLVPGEGIWFQNQDTILDRVYDVAGLEPRFETHFETGPVGHKLEYGARVLGETAQYQQLTGSAYDSDTGALDYVEHHRSVAEATYVQDTIAFRDDLLVTPGLRLEHVDFHRAVLRQGDANKTAAGDLSSDGVVPGVGLIFGSRDTHVFGGVHMGWQPQRVASSFSPNGAPAVLSPQRSVNYEIGSRFAPARWARGEVTGFLLSYMNETIAGNASSNGGASLANGGPTRHIGVEAAATVQVGRALKWKTDVDVIARYSYARATFVGGPYDGNILPYAPLSTFSAVLGASHPTGFGGEVAFYYTDAQFADPLDTRAENATGEYGTIPAHTDLDANLRYKHAATGLSIRLSVKDALQDYYITERRPNGIAVGGFRQITLGLRWDWETKDKPSE